MKPDFELKKGKQKRRKKSRRLRQLNIVLFALYVMAVVLFLLYGYRHHFLGLEGIGLVIPLVLAFSTLAGTIAIWKKRGSWLLSLYLMTAIVLMGIGLYFQMTLVDVSQRVNQSATYQEVEMQVLVPVDSDVTDLSQLQAVLTASASDGGNTKQLLDHIATEKEIFLEERATSSYQESYERLLAKQDPAMVFNSAYAQLLELTYPDYASQVRVIYRYQVRKQVKQEEKQISSSEAFHIYISGIDTYGPISSVSRSDVNILMTINPQTGQVLLTTTPRDAYVPIAGGGNGQPDKLTHAGIYGVTASVETLENLYGIDISYYARINFTSFLNLIDVLGGIEVYNDQEFTSRIGGFHFPKGTITLNSQQALGFVRERYNLSQGDADRGRNHNKVVAAIFKKLISVKSLSNYQAIIDGVGDSIQTDMPLSVMLRLANQQLASGRSYSIRSQSLEGHGSTGELVSYAMPQASLYMLSIDPTSLQEVTQEIYRTAEGE